MSRSFFRHLRRCRVLFALALCAWLSLAGAAWAHADCCAGAGGVMTMAHHDAAPSSPHAGSVHVDCTCAHALAVLPELAPLAWRMSFATSVWQTGPAEAPDLPRAPPLRPPLA